MEHHHISNNYLPSSQSIDIYLDKDAGEVRIVDSVNKENRITIGGGDWNELVNRIKTGKIGQLRS